MAKFTIQSEKSTTLRLEQEGDGVSLIASNGADEQYILEISDEGIITLIDVDAAEARRLGFSVKNKRGNGGSGDYVEVEYE